MKQRKPTWKQKQKDVKVMSKATTEKNGQTPKFDIGSIDFSALSFKQLQALQERAAVAAEAARESKRVDLRVKIEGLLSENGFSLSELFPSEFKRLEKGRRSPATIQYRNPDDPSQTWTGRGRMPRWLQAKIDEGRDQDSFRIRGSSPGGSGPVNLATSGETRQETTDEEARAA
jgi:DNA-binding protein H-NS